MVYKLIQFLLRVYLPVLFKRLEYRGLENVPQDKPVIFAVNHQNAFLDGILVALWYFGLREIVDTLKEFRLGIGLSFVTSSFGRSIYLMIMSKDV